MAEYEDPVEVMDLDEGDKSSDNGAAGFDFVVQAVDAEIGDAYSYSGSDTYRQMGEAWRRYYQLPFGNEDAEEEASDYVSEMLTTHVNQTRAWAVSKYGATTAPIVKFRPRGPEDVMASDAATEYTNHLLRNKLNGNDIIDRMVFNAALLKIAPVRVYVRPKMGMATKETMEHEFEGTEEEVLNDLADFEANEANSAVADLDPTLSEVSTIDEAGQEVPVDPQAPLPPETVRKVRLSWDLKLPEEKEVAVEVLSPGAFFVSRQAETLEEARMVATISIDKVGWLKSKYPDAPQLNIDRGNFGGDSDDFWQDLQSEYIEWFRENEWLERWNYDALGLNETEDTTSSDESAGLGAKEIYVMDAEIWMDEGRVNGGDDTGDVKLYHVVKAGRYVLHLEEVSERSFVCRSLIPTGNKWIGLSLFDILQGQIREESALSRAFSDGSIRAANPTPVIDFSQVEPKDAIDIQPGKIIRKKQGVAGAGPAVEFVQPNGPDGSVITAIEMFKANASNLTGVGLGFQGGTATDTASMRLGEEAAKVVQSNTQLMQNYFSHKLDAMLAELCVKIWNTAVKGGASPEMYHHKDEWQSLDPSQQEARTEFIINGEVGVNARKERLEKAQALLGIVAQPVPGIQWLPMMGYKAAKEFLEANEIFDVDNYVVNPQAQQDIAQDPQVMAFLQQAEQTMQLQTAQAVEMARQEVLMMPETMLKQAQAELASAKAKAATKDSNTKADSAAANIAVQVDREERIDERSAVDQAINLEQLELQKMELEEEIRLAKKQVAMGQTRGNIGAG